MGIFERESLRELLSDILSEGGAAGVRIACVGLWAELLSLLGVPIIGDRGVGLAIFVRRGLPVAPVVVMATLELEEDFLLEPGLGN